MKFLTKGKQGGFTLVELVVVIVILGILSAFAIPKFIDLSVTARQAVYDATLGNIRAAANIAHAQAQAEGETGATGTVTIQGTAITLANGYPDRDGIEDMIDLSGVTYVANTGVFTVDANSNCTITYTAASANGIPGIAQTSRACN